jgi:hypothetical protein
MNNPEITRRAIFSFFGACVLGVVGPSADAFARLGAVGGIHVDVKPLMENSGDPTAAWVAETMPAALAQALADVGRAGASITVRIDYVILGPNSGGTGPAGSSPDQMIGEVMVGGVERPLRAQNWYYPSASDAAMIAQSNYDRIYHLSRAFAYWAARGY